MSGAWAQVWRSRGAAACVGLLASVALASVLYAFNWHTFYDTQRNLAYAQAERLAEDVRDLVSMHPDGAGAEAAVQRHVDRREGHVRVTLARAGDGEVLWQVDGRSVVDPRRTRLSERFSWPLDDDLVLDVEVLQGIRPPLSLALWRAWTFSADDWLSDPRTWREQALYNRSLPLYGYWLTVLVVGFGTVRALHRDQLELDRVDAQAREATTELSDLRDLNRRETGTLRARVADTERQRDEAVRERTRLDAEIAAVDREFDDATRGRPPDRVDDERLRAIKTKKSRMERVLAEHDAMVDHYETELGHSREELSAAEELLSEVEAHHTDLEEKLRDRNREIRRLEELVVEARRGTRAMAMETSQHLSRQAARAAIRQARGAGLERQLDDWIEPNEDGVHVNFSAHSRTGAVEALFEKLDRDFVDRFFTHATNPEYERGARRILRVHADPSGAIDDDARAGEIVIVLDDDAGRTLGLRYALRRGAPDASLVGFVLALLLRAGCRDIARYPIRVR